MKLDKVIKNATVVNASDIYVADIGIKDGLITIIGNNIERDNDCKEIIDAKGKYIFPGGIDVHTHLDLSINSLIGEITTKDDFKTGTIAAACGGTTSIVDHCFQKKGQKICEALNIWHNKADKKAVIDYGFHIGISDLNKEVLDELKIFVKKGYPSCKVYMAYNFRLNDNELLMLFNHFHELGGLVCIHAENYFIIDQVTKKLLHSKKNTPKYHHISRPIIAELEATNRAIAFAEFTKTQIYFVHVTCKDALEEISRAKIRNKTRILAETCTQYLLLNNRKYNLQGFESAKYVLSPPLRTLNDQNALWHGLINNDISVVASDHCSFDYKGQKDIGNKQFSFIPNGIAGIELRIPLLYDRGVNSRKLTLNKFVEIISTNPAKIFGLYPQKGTIAIGSDADLIIFDPYLKKNITKSSLHENVDYTPYEGFTVTGYPVITISRGDVIVKNGIFVGDVGRGKFLSRKLPNFK